MVLLFPKIKFPIRRRRGNGRRRFMVTSFLLFLPVARTIKRVPILLITLLIIFRCGAGSPRRRALLLKRVPMIGLGMKSRILMIILTRTLKPVLTKNRFIRLMLDLIRPRRLVIPNFVVLFRRPVPNMVWRLLRGARVVRLILHPTGIMMVITSLKTVTAPLLLRVTLRFQNWSRTVFLIPG